MTYRTYVTDAMRLMGEHKFINTRWYDLVHPTDAEDVDAEAVVADIVSRAGLVMA